MQAIAAARQTIMGVPPQTSNPVRGTYNKLSKLWQEQIQAPGANEWSWQTAKVRFMHTIELLPDATTILDAIRTISLDYGVQPPVVLRVAYTASATFCTILIPGVIRELLSLISIALPKGMRKGPHVHHSVGITYLATIAATLIAVGADGIRDICDVLHIPSKHLEKIVTTILPWIPYILRISMIVQSIDILGGAVFQKDLAEKVGKPLNSSWGRKQAQGALSAIFEHRHYARRANDGAHGLKYTVLKLEQGVNSWNPLRSALAVRQTQKLAKSLNERSIYYMRNQIFGFGANLFALLALMMTHVVGAAALSIVSASYYWTQTSHGWESPPQASLRQKPAKGGDEFSVWRTLTSGADFGKWAVEQVVG